MRFLGGRLMSVAHSISKVEKKAKQFPDRRFFKGMNLRKVDLCQRINQAQDRLMLAIENTSSEKLLLLNVMR
jgi:hypothetical protein